MAFQGILCAFPLFCGQDCPSCRLKLCPCAVLTARGLFAHKFLCTGAGEASPLLASARFGLNRRPWRRSERRKARARPHARTLEDAASFIAEPGQPDDGGDARRRARKEHTARQAERARQRREDDRRDSGDARARAPRATDCDQREQGTRARPPAPAKITARVRPEGEHEGGKGGAPRGRGGGRGTRPRETERTTPPHRQPNAGTAASDSARRRAAGAKQDGKPDDSPPRGRKTERGQRPSRPGRRRRDGQRARKPPHPAPRHSTARTTPADGDTAARRTATAQAGRKQNAKARPPPRRQRRKTPKQDATARARPTRRARTTAATGGSTHARRAGTRCANAQTASEQRAQRANARKAGGRAKARTRPPREAAGAAARPPPSQTPGATRTQRAARPIVARRCGHFRADGRR